MYVYWYFLNVDNWVQINYLLICYNIIVFLGASEYIWISLSAGNPIAIHCSENLKRLKTKEHVIKRINKLFSFLVMDIVMIN